MNHHAEMQGSSHTLHSILLVCIQDFEKNLPHFDAVVAHDHHYLVEQERLTVAMIMVLFAVGPVVSPQNA